MGSGLVRTFDADWIRSVVTHPRVWPWVSDDDQKAENYRPSLSQSTYYLRYGDYGFFSFKPLTSIALEIHACLLPKAPAVDEAARAAIDWIFENTTALKLVFTTCETHRHAAELARRVGFEDEGRMKNAILWRGKVRDILILGMNKWKLYP